MPLWKRCSVSAWLMVVLALISLSASAIRLTDIRVYSGDYETQVILSFDARPKYTLLPLQGSEGILLDIEQNVSISGLPLTFPGANLLKKIRSGQSRASQHTLLMLEVTKKVKVRAMTQSSGETCRLVLTLVEDKNDLPVPSASNQRSNTSPLPVARKQRENARITTMRTGAALPQAEKNRQTRAGDAKPVVIAIDAGHGGQDPGAISLNGLKEKVLTMSIARKLSTVLKQDPGFKPVLTRDGDYFVSVMKRSDIARKQGADILISIHADAAPNRSAAGSSVWVLSNRRANSELGNWLEQHEKQSELLGGAGNMLANAQSDIYLSQAVLDLQFGHSQRVGYDIAVKILKELQDIVRIHKQRPEHASLGILRSPDIPSLLIETGFISNSVEEQLLSTHDHQDKLVLAIHKGLRAYFQASAVQITEKGSQQAQQTVPLINRSPPVTRRLIQPGPIFSAKHVPPGNQAAHVLIHTVQLGETLSGIASHYGVSMSVLREMNVLKKEVIWTGQRLKIPASTSFVTSMAEPSVKSAKHIVKRSDTLSSIALRYGVNMSEIQKINELKSAKVQVGQILVIPLPAVLRH